MQNYYRAAELAEKLGVSRATVWLWAKAGRLPKPVKLGPRVTVWREEDVMAALDKIARESTGHE